jgi:hypothetical protein
MFFASGEDNSEQFDFVEGLDRRRQREGRFVVPPAVFPRRPAAINAIVTAWCAEFS